MWAYDVTLDDGDYYLIAEVNRGSGDQGYIGLKRGSRDGALYFLGYEGGDPEPLGTSFRAAMEKYLPSKWGLR